MGRIACAALQDAPAGIAYAGGFARTRVPSEQISDDLSEMFLAHKPDVLLDLTTHPSTVQIATAALERGVRPVIGATGWTHDERRDRPSGTSLLTAERIRAAGGAEDVAIHSVRLRGLVAHQEVLFGNTGELLTIRHDSLSRESFVTGMYLAIRAVMDARGLVVGLDAVVDGGGR